MLDGWYCRSIANMQAEDEAARNSARSSRPVTESADRPDDCSSESSQPEPERVDYKNRYDSLKKKLKLLIYENECFQDALRSSQKRLLRACRDRSFLLDRLLEHEKPSFSSSDSEEADSSDNAETIKREGSKRRRTGPIPPAFDNGPEMIAPNKNPSMAKRKRPPLQKKIVQNSLPAASLSNKYSSFASDGHMTPEEVERHLQSRQSFLELVPERAPPTVPTEMFSNDPSLDSESNDILETSPRNIGDDWIE